MRRRDKLPKVPVYHCSACKMVLVRCTEDGTHDKTGDFLVCPEAQREWKGRVTLPYYADARSGGRRHEKIGIEPLAKRHSGYARAQKAIAQRQQVPIFEDPRVGMREVKEK